MPLIMQSGKWTCCKTMSKWRSAFIILVVVLATYATISKVIEHISIYKVNNQMQYLVQLRMERETNMTLRSDFRQFFSPRGMKPIPKIIHQVYRDADIPSAYVYYIKTWTEKNPDYEYWFWDNESGRQLIATAYPEFLDTYDSYCHDLFRSDAMRYFIMHKFGGIYIDMDYECLRPIGNLLDGKFAHVVQEYKPQAELFYNGDMLMNSWMASVPSHPFWKYIIANLPLRARCHFDDVLTSTGPLLLKDMWYKYYEITKCNKSLCEVNVLPYKLMDPEWDTNRMTRVNMFFACEVDPRLTALQRKACSHFRAKDYIVKTKQDTHPNAYAIHKYLHIGNLASKYVDKSGYSNIEEVVPRVVFPMKRPRSVAPATIKRFFRTSTNTAGRS